MNKWIGILVVFMFLAVSVSVAGELMETIDIHGFGGWGYGDTDGNHYTLGSADGDYHHAYFSLNVTANPHKKLWINSQVQWTQEHDGDVVELDFIFARWHFNDKANFLIGKIKHPFGIYTQIQDVGTLRPFFCLPQSVYGPTGITAEAYNGLGLSGSHYFGNWGWNYDLYGGEIILEDSHAWHMEEEEGEEHEHEESVVGEDHVEDVIGGRLNISTPVDGLRFGISAYTGKPGEAHSHDADEDHVAEKPSFGDHTSYGTHIEFLNEDWWIRTEYAVHDHSGGENTQAAYFEAAYKFTERWQLAGRYEWLETDVEGWDEFMLPDSFLEHTDAGLSLNFWF